MMRDRSKNNYITFLLLILAFIVPILVSWFLYFYHEHFQFNTTNHGSIVSPPINVKAWLDNDNQRKWQIVYISGDFCDNQCVKITDILNQIKKALGKNNERVRIKQILPTTENGIEKKLGRVNFVTHNKIYLVDPDGNLFMYYPDSVDPMNILKDMKRVLEVSQIG